VTFIAEGSAGPNGEGGRTVTNGTVYDRRKVYEITTSAELAEAQSEYGTGEVNRTGRFVTEQRVYHVIADSRAMAEALYVKHWGGPHSSIFGGHTLVSIKPLFVIDGEITTGHK
jgi:hypothetical protein